MRSLCDMAGLTPKNVIFLLNKWDAISYKDDAQQEQFYKETKRTICKIWKKVNGSYIFKISTLKVLHNEINIGLNRYIDIAHISKPII